MKIFIDDKLEKQMNTIYKNRKDIIDRLDKITNMFINFKSIEEWHKVVDKIILSFEIMKNFKDLKYLRASKKEFNKLIEKYEEGMELFKKYLGDLWD